MDRKGRILIVKYTKAPNAHPSPLHRGNETDAGMDIRASEQHAIPPLCREAIGTGIFLEIPYGYYGRIAPRSGLALKHGIDVLAGVVDSGYRGEIKVILYNTDKEQTFRVEAGDKVAQIIIEKHYNFDFVETESIGESERGEKGFGSTG